MVLTMIIPKVLLLSVPLLVLVEAQYSSQNVRSLPVRRPIPRNTWMRNTYQSPKKIDSIAPNFNNIQEPTTIVYPDHYTTPAPFRRPMWSGPRRFDFERQSSTYSPTFENPSGGLQSFKENVDVPQSTKAEVPAEESSTQAQTQAPEQILETKKPLKSRNNPVVDDIREQNRFPINTASEAYEKPKTNIPIAQEQAPEYWDDDENKNVAYQSFEEYINAHKPVWKPITKPTTTTTTTTTTTSTTTRKPKTHHTTSTTTGSPRKENILYNYNCRQANGYEAVPKSCSHYVECNNYNAYKSKCPEGLHFDATVQYPGFPCGQASLVKCQSGPVIIEPQHECPKPSGYFPLPVGDCGKFILCQNGAATEMLCPPGLAYNSETSSCDWPVNVPGCNPEAFKGFSCPAAVLDDSDEPVDLISNHRYKNSCKNYIACLKGFPRLLSCDTDYSFDSKTNKCVDSDIVTNCEY